MSPRICVSMNLRTTVSDFDFGYGMDRDLGTWAQRAQETPTSRCDGACPARTRSHPGRATSLRIALWCPLELTVSSVYLSVHLALPACVLRTVSELRSEFRGSRLCKRGYFRVTVTLF